MKKIFTLFVSLIFWGLTSEIIANDNQLRGVDLGEYAFGIPAEQLNFTNQSSFTLSFWINIKELNHDKGSTQFLNIRNPDYNASYDKGGGYPLCDWGYVFSTLQEYGLDDNGEVWENNELLISVREDGASKSTPFIRERIFQFVPHDWIYVTFISYYTNAPQLILYINGDATLKFKSTLTSPSTLMKWYQDYIIMIGGPAKNRGSLNAYIDKVQLYNKALSESEVKESMVTPLLNDESLLGYWDFEDGCTTNTDGFMTADNGTIKAAMYKILQGTTELSIGTEIQPFTYGEGVTPESVLQDVVESKAEISNTKAYVANCVLYIEINEDINQISIYDSLGRTILSTNLSPKERGVIAIPLNFNIKGLLLVRVNDEVVKVICE